MKWVLLAASAIVGYQTLFPPIVGLADQGDFERVIGKFGYGPLRPAYTYAYVSQTYVPDPAYRLRDWEQFSSEDLFVGVVVLVSSVISKSGAIDIRLMGTIHGLAFLAALTWLLRATRTCRFHKWLWAAIVLVSTDVAYVAYFNSFYAEPASYIFFLLLLAESIGLAREGVSAAKVWRWSAWAVLLVLAKPANAPIGVLVGLYAIRLAWQSRAAWAGAAAILAAVAFSVMTSPQPMMDVNTYDMVFKAVLPESKTPAADAIALGLDPGMESYSGRAAWSPDSDFSAMRISGVIGRRVTPVTVLKFYLARPARAWRHIRWSLPSSTILRPPLGNFVKGTVHEPVTQSQAFALWSGFHEHGLSRVTRGIFLLLAAPAIALLIRRLLRRAVRLGEEMFALLALCAMTSFLTATFADAWETVKHLFFYNCLLDATLLSGAALAWTAGRGQTAVHEVADSPGIAAGEGEPESVRQSLRR